MTSSISKFLSASILICFGCGDGGYRPPYHKQVIAFVTNCGDGGTAKALLDPDPGIDQADLLETQKTSDGQPLVSSVAATGAYRVDFRLFNGITCPTAAVYRTEQSECVRDNQAPAGCQSKAKVVELRQGTHALLSPQGMYSLGDTSDPSLD